MISRSSERTWPVIILTACIAVLGGCASGKTYVTQPPMTKIVAASVMTEEIAATVAVPDEPRSHFRAALEEQLYQREISFAKGPDLTIKWQFIQYDEGSRAKRYFVGFGAGKGSLAIQAKFYDDSGKELATIQSEGEISMGAFGGSFDSAIEKCAEEIATYTKKNFR